MCSSAEQQQGREQQLQLLAQLQRHEAQIARHRQQAHEIQEELRQMGFPQTLGDAPYTGVPRQQGCINPEPAALQHKVQQPQPTSGLSLPGNVEAKRQQQQQQADEEAVQQQAVQQQLQQQQAVPLLVRQVPRQPVTVVPLGLLVLSSVAASVHSQQAADLQPAAANSVRPDCASSRGIGRDAAAPTEVGNKQGRHSHNSSALLNEREDAAYPPVRDSAAADADAVAAAAVGASSSSTATSAGSSSTSGTGKNTAKKTIAGKTNHFKAALLAFGQSIADAALQQMPVELCFESWIHHTLEQSLQLKALILQQLQKLEDHMNEETPDALGEPVNRSSISWEIQGGHTKAAKHSAASSGGQAARAAAATGVDVKHHDVSYEEVEQLFQTCTVEDAAESLHIGLTTLKHLIRDKIGIKRWPHRVFNSIDNALEQLLAKEEQAKDKEKLPGRILMLQHARYLLLQHPNMRFEFHPASHLIQALHKQKHKREKSMRAGCKRAAGPRALLHMDMAEAATS